MRKKILSALLLGLFTVASTSTFVSCKDYDDDVKNLQEQITTNDTNLKKLVEDKIALVNAEIEKTNKAISDAEKAYKAADEELQKQINAANKAITDGDKATLDAAKKAVEDAMVTVSTTYATKAELEKAQQDLTAAYEKADKVLNDKIDAKVEELVLANKDLDDAVQKAQKRADDAYTFAESISNDLKANYATKKELSDAVANLKETIGGVKKELTDLINANTNKITDLNTRLGTAEGKITKAEGRITANEFAISKLDSLTKVHTADLAKLNSRLPKVADSLKVLYDKVAVLGESLNTVADTLSQNYRAAVNAAVAQLRNDVKDSLNPIRIDINDLGTRVTREVRRLDGNIEKANDSIDVVAANLKAVDNRVVAIESRLGVISGDLSNLITSIIYNGQTKNVILYGDVAADVKFPTTENKLLEFKKDQILMAHNNGFIYATINPAQIDFEGTSVKVVNSQNKECSLVKLANAVAVTEKDPILTITRAKTGATKNLGNGLYKLDVTTAGVAAKGAFDGVQAFRAATDGTTTSYVAYALQTEYKAGDSTRTVTSHYDVAFKPTHAVNAELNDIDIHAVEPGIDVAGNAAYTMKFSNVTSGEMKIEIKNKKNVYAAYVELAADQSDAIKKGTTLPKTVIADTDLDKNVPISITDDLINKPIKLHWYFLNYDGTIVEKTDEAVVFSTSVFGNITVEKTWTINSAANQVVDFKAELQKAIKATAGKIDGKEIAEDKRLAKFAELMGVASIDSIKTVLKSGVTTDSIAVNLTKKADNTDIEATKFTFNPALVNNENKVTQVEQVVDVTTTNGLEVASIKYIVNVVDPSYLDALDLRIASAFNVIDKDADYAKDLTVAWAHADAVGTDQTSTTYVWDTRSFVISKFVDNLAATDNTTKLIYNELPNAKKNTYVTLSGDNKTADATIFCKNIRTYSGNGVESENTNVVPVGSVQYKGAAPGDNDSVGFKMQQIINYYGIIKKTHDTFYFSVVSPVNYGIFKGGAKTINANVDNVGHGVAKLSDFVWEDYSDNMTKFDLSDGRITSIKCQLVPDSGNNYGRVEVPTDGSDPIKVNVGSGVDSNNLSNATLNFNMIPGSATSDCVLEVKLIVKDQWGIQTTMNGTINVKTSHAGAKKH